MHLIFEYMDDVAAKALVRCPECRDTWYEPYRDLRHVVALTCPIGHMLAVPMPNFRGDIDPENEGLDE